MTRVELFEQIKRKQSYLCVGLDSDPEKIPKHLLKTEDPLFEFNKQVIDATKEYCVAYKPNLAFYESLGWRGLQSLEKTVQYIPKDIFTIADAKRGDIGNTSELYAKAFFNHYGFDAVTVAPYMGSDSVKPFLKHKNKWVILLALTSNEGSADFQKLVVGSNPLHPLFEEVIQKSGQWGNEDEIMFVIGATHPELFAHIRKIVPHHFFLVPGVGAQGGSLRDVSMHGMNGECGLLVNSSRQIIYASNGEDFAARAGEEAKKTQVEMKRYLDEFLK